MNQFDEQNGYVFWPSGAIESLRTSEIKEYEQLNAKFINLDETNS